MGKDKYFIGWDRALCGAVSEFILEKRAGVGGQGGFLDLRDTVIVTPTRQSAWRFRAALPQVAQRAGVTLLGPDIVTPPVLLAPPAMAGTASDFQLLAAWVAVLKRATQQQFPALLGSRKISHSTAWALQTARQLQKLRSELADDGYTLASVAESGKATEEQDRWNDLKAVEAMFYAELSEQGLVDPLARKVAYAQEGRLAESIRQVVLAAVPDPPLLLMRLLEGWAEKGGRVDILVASPEAEASNFDEWGRPLPEQWDKERGIALANEDLWVCANPGTAAVRIVRAVAPSLEGKVADESQPRIAIGVPDREAVAPLQRELAALGLQAFDPQDQPFVATPLAHLLQALLDFAERPGYAQVATLIRHPHVMSYFGDGDKLLRQLDTFQNTHLPVTLEDMARQFKKEDTSSDGQEALSAAIATLGEWRKNLSSGDLPTALRAVLREIYADNHLPTNAEGRVTQQTITTFDDILRQVEDGVQNHAGEMADTAQLLTALLHDASVKAERTHEKLDLEGWLELIWNDAPLAFMIGMNEGFVPDGHLGDVFLPDSLRSLLGLRDDKLRVARDAYLLTAMHEQRRDAGRVILVVNKTSMAGDPLKPSRLLFRCSDEELVERAKLIFAEPPQLTTPPAFTIDPSWKLQPSAALELIRRDPVVHNFQKRLKFMSPSAFNSYLQCPFRFYLREVLMMEPVDDRAREPDARAFGNLAHHAVERMAKDAIEQAWGAAEWQRLEAYLNETLEREVIRVYGARRWLGVDLVLDSLRGRLSAFAQKQREAIEDGWKIIEGETWCEFKIQDCEIRGRIDRIDMSGDGRTIRIFDYKTSDKATSVASAHTGKIETADILPAALLPDECLKKTKTGAIEATEKGKGWKNLQLPLYYEYARKHFEGLDVQIGYINLPKSRGDTGFDIWADYNETLHHSAMACANAIIDNIREGIFWPPSPLPSHWTDDFAGLILGDPARTISELSSPWEVPL